MNHSHHGITFGIERLNDHAFLSFKAIGKLTHQDYQLMTPMLESALLELPQVEINMLVDLSEFQGWELSAAWDDFKLGVKHGDQFDKVAIYGDKNWQQVAAKVANWFVVGQVKSFHDYQQALNWLQQD